MPRDVRSAIVDSAIELFYEQNYCATGVQQIVEHAGYTKGAFYHYFKSKEALLIEIHDTFMDYAIGRGRRILEEKHDPEAALRLLMVELLRQVDLYLPHMTITFQESPYLSFEEYPESKAKRDEYEKIVFTVLEAGMRSGRFRNDIPSSHVLAYGLMGMCVWAYQWYRPGGSMSAEQIGEMYASVLIQGLLAKNTGGASDDPMLCLGRSQAVPTTDRRSHPVQDN